MSMSILASETNVGNGPGKERLRSAARTGTCDPSLLSSSAAHDLCNHLQVLASALNILERGMRGGQCGPIIGGRFDPMSSVLMGARVSLDRANRLSRALVDRGRTSRGRPQAVVLADRLAALQETVLLAVGPGIHVELSVAADVPDVNCAAEALDDAVLNLVVNAARATPCGGRISIRAECDRSPPEMLPIAVLRIADTGEGMAAEVAARAFEPRFTTRARGQGSGIGLAMVAEFARSAGGSVSLASQPGMGTIVTIRLPGLIKPARSAAASS